jgi:hypothetical protein
MVRGRIVAGRRVAGVEETGMTTAHHPNRNGDRRFKRKTAKASSALRMPTAGVCRRLHQTGISWDDFDEL